MLVYVLNKNGKPLMPCKQAKARKLLRSRKAKMVKRTPFTIQLNWDCEDNIQKIILGVDSGYKTIGLSAVSDKQELFASEVKLRTDIKNLLAERRQYRRLKRNRLWYRKPRFLNRVKTKKKGWLAPSIKHKLNGHIKTVQLVSSILPISNIILEVAAFDIQKIKNPDISGAEYQNGEQAGFLNVREYVLHRDGHTCQACKGKSKDKILNVHHIIQRTDGGTDKPNNLITLCETCHMAYHKGRIILKVKPPKEFKSETFMSMVRWKLVNILRDMGYVISHTYGYITKSARIALKLTKSHINDAFCIAKGQIQGRMENNYLIKLSRKCNRSLYKANLLRGGKRKRNTIKQAFGFQRFDKVLYSGIECFIYGLRSSGYFDIRSLIGGKIRDSVKYNKLKLIEYFKQWRIALIPALTDRVFEL
jgi:hypothetical protein